MNLAFVDNYDFPPRFQESHFKKVFVRGKFLKLKKCKIALDFQIPADFCPCNQRWTEVHGVNGLSLDGHRSRLPPNLKSLL